MELFNTPIESPVIILITVLYFFTSSIEVFDIRVNQAIKDGTDIEPLPQLIGLIYWLNWFILLSLILSNWKYAILVYVIRFFLKVLPVLETVGNFLMAPFRKH